MRKRSGQVHSRESSATLQLTVSLLYRSATFLLTDRKKLGYNYTCVVGGSDVTQPRGVAQLG